MLKVNTVIKHQTKCACMNYTNFTRHGLDTQNLQEEIYTVEKHISVCIKCCVFPEIVD